MFREKKKPVLEYEENEKYRDDLKSIGVGDAKRHLHGCSDWLKRSEVFLWEFEHSSGVQ